jgi:hypothetical protein
MGPLIIYSVENLLALLGLILWAVSRLALKLA